MNPDFSRRAALTFGSPVIVSLPSGEWSSYQDACFAATDFPDLAAFAQELLLAAERLEDLGVKVQLRSDRVVDAVGNAHDEHGMFTSKGGDGAGGPEPEGRVKFARFTAEQRADLLAKFNEAVRTQGDDYWQRETDTPNGKGDAPMTEIVNANGFGGKPTVVSEEQLAKVVGNGGYELWRGVTRPQYADQTRDGPFRVGQGSLGSGMYFAVAMPGDTQAERDFSKGYARSYAENGVDGRLMHAALPADVKTIDWRDAVKAMQEDDGHFQWSFGVPSDPALIMFNQNVGRWAASHGYDAVSDGDIFNVVNRSALYVSDHDEKARPDRVRV
jgi:hypothetical protein